MTDKAIPPSLPDVPEAVIETSRLQSLADVSAAFAEVGLDYASAIETVARRIAELMGDLCAITLLSEDREWLEPVAICHPDPRGEAMARGLTDLLRVPALGGLGYAVIGQGQALYVEQLDDSMFSDVTRPFYYTYREAVGSFGMLVAPLRAQGTIIGMVIVLRTAASPRHSSDLRFLQDLADRAAITIAGARLHQSVRQELAARHLVEQTLVRREREFRTLVENSTDAILRYDCSLRLTYINSVAAQAFGGEAADFIGRLAAELPLQDTLIRPFITTAPRVIAGGEPASYTQEVRGVIGEARFVHTQLVPEFGEDGEVESVLVVARDLTDLRQAQEEVEQLNRTLEARVEQRTAQLEAAYQELRAITGLLQASELRLQFLLGHTPGVIYTARAGGDYGITFVSDSATDVIGYAPWQLADPPTAAYSLIHPDDRERLFEGDRSLFEQGRRTVEFRFRHADGEYRWVRSGMLLVRDERGRPQEIIGYLVDISDLKQAEEALRFANAELHLANLELARAARMKDEFLASVSHELRTPLNAILGRVETLQEQIHGPLNERQLRAARSIEESGRHLLELINDILDLSKIEAGRLELNLTSVSVIALCESSLRMVAQSALKKRVAVNVSVQEGLSAFPGDERRLKQILVNLLSNAVKFTPEGGAVGLDVSEDAVAGMLRFDVWDTGIGIAAEDLARLFKPFVQLDSGLARQYNGTGLGLVLVARMAELHGGEVLVESEPGRGSRFTVILPRHEPPTSISSSPPPELGRPAPAAEEPAAGAPDARPIVLLADDNSENVAVMQEYISRHGYRVEIARDGYEAVTHAVNLRPAVILMDIQMPGMNGLEAIGEIRAAPGLEQVPIIALTALAMQGDRERCLAAGASDYLSKPVGLRDLIRAIETHRRSYLELQQ
jgi:PAS domain S-box-containing protein